MTVSTIAGPGAAPAAPAPAHGSRPDPTQVRFLSQAIALEEGRPPHAARLAVAFSSLLFVGAVVWAAATHVEKIAATTGQILPSGMIQSIQHLEGGIVQKILVVEGDLVEAGQVMMRLDPTGARAELEQLRARDSALQLQTERLRAFAERRPAQLAPAQLRGSAFAADQIAILQMQERARASQRVVLERQLDGRRAEIATLEEQRTTLDKQIRIVSQTLEMRAKLLEQGLTSRIIYLETEREVTRLQGELAQATSNARRAREGAAEAEARLLETEARLANESLGEMGRLSAEIAQVREGIARAEDRVARLEIRSPVRGLVKEMRMRTVGGVLQPGAIVMDVVPIGQDLIAEVRISPRDVGQIIPGQEVWAKVTAFDFARFGAVPGTLKSFSATTFQDPQDGQLYYRGIILLGRNYVGERADRNPLMPGMVVQADIRLGDRTVLEYLFTPIYASLSGAMRER